MILTALAAVAIPTLLMAADEARSVSYTHLTLPTILRA